MQRPGTSWQVGGGAMHSLLYPVSNEREAMRRQGLKPKDHVKENARRLRDMQQHKVRSSAAVPAVLRRALLRRVLMPECAAGGTAAATDGCGAVQDAALQGDQEPGAPVDRERGLRQTAWRRRAAAPGHGEWLHSQGRR